MHSRAICANAASAHRCLRRCGAAIEKSETRVLPCGPLTRASAQCDAALPWDRTVGHARSAAVMNALEDRAEHFGLSKTDALQFEQASYLRPCCAAHRWMASATDADGASRKIRVEHCCREPWSLSTRKDARSLLSGVAIKIPKLLGTLSRLHALSTG
jgi:hypothetical protein